MQQSSELLYCFDFECKQPNKIMRNLDEYLESNHNGHKIKKLNLLRTELQQIETEPYIRQLDLIKFIDNEIESISNLFSSQLSNKLRSFIEIKKKPPDQDFIQLYQAILDDDQQNILVYQNQLDLLLISNQSQSQQQNLTIQNIQNQLGNVVKFTIDHISEINKNKFDPEWENQQKLISSNNKIQAQPLQQRQEKENDVIVQLMSLNQEQGLIIYNQSNDLEQLKFVLKNEQLQYSQSQDQLKQSNAKMIQEQYQSQNSSDLQQLQQALLVEQQNSLSIEKELKSTINFVNQLKDQLNQKTKQYGQNIEKMEFERRQLNDKYVQLLKKNQKVYETNPKKIQYDSNQIKQKWSSIAKHSDIEIVDKFAKLQGAGSDYKSILFLQEMFSVGKILTIKLKISADNMVNNHFMVHICNLQGLNIRCPEFVNLYKCGIYSLKSDGTVYKRDGTSYQSKLKLKLGNLIELRWNGPQKIFTIMNITTQLKLEVLVELEEPNQIHFGVSLNNGNQAQIF